MKWQVTIVYGRGSPASRTFSDLGEAFLFIQQCFDADPKDDDWHRVVAAKIERSEEIAK